MASYTIAAGDTAAHDKTLVASTVDTVTFTDTIRAVEIISDGTAAIYLTTDGTTPTVSGPKTSKLPAGTITSLTLTPTSGEATAIKLISPGTPTYSVQKAA